MLHDDLSGINNEIGTSASVLAHCIAQYYEDTYILVPKDFTITSNRCDLFICDPEELHSLSP